MLLSLDGCDWLAGLAAQVRPGRSKFGRLKCAEIRVVRRMDCLNSDAMNFISSLNAKLNVISTVEGSQGQQALCQCIWLCHWAPPPPGAAAEGEEQPFRLRRVLQNVPEACQRDKVQNNLLAVLSLDLSRTHIQQTRGRAALPVVYLCGVHVGLMSWSQSVP